MKQKIAFKSINNLILLYQQKQLRYYPGNICYLSIDNLILECQNVL